MEGYSYKPRFIGPWYSHDCNHSLISTFFWLRPCVKGRFHRSRIYPDSQLSTPTRLMGTFNHLTRCRLSNFNDNTCTWWIVDRGHYLSLSFENKLHSAVSIIIFQGLWWHSTLWSRRSTSCKSGKWSTGPAMVDVQVTWIRRVWQDSPVDEETLIS